MLKKQINKINLDRITTHMKGFNQVLGWPLTKQFVKRKTSILKQIYGMKHLKFKVFLSVTAVKSSLIYDQGPTK